MVTLAKWPVKLWKKLKKKKRHDEAPAVQQPSVQDAPTIDLLRQAVKAPTLEPDTNSGLDDVKQLLLPATPSTCDQPRAIQPECILQLVQPPLPICQPSKTQPIAPQSTQSSPDHPPQPTKTLHGPPLQPASPTHHALPCSIDSSTPSPVLLPSPALIPLATSTQPSPTTTAHASASALPPLSAKQTKQPPTTHQPYPLPPIPRTSAHRPVPNITPHPDFNAFHYAVWQRQHLQQQQQQHPPKPAPEPKPLSSQPPSTTYPEIQMIWPLCLTAEHGATTLAVKLAPFHHPTLTPSPPDQNPATPPGVRVCIMADGVSLAELVQQQQPHVSAVQGSVPPCPHHSSSTCGLAVTTAFAVVTGDSLSMPPLTPHRATLADSKAYASPNNDTHSSSQGKRMPALAPSRITSFEQIFGRVSDVETAVGASSQVPGPAVSVLSVPEVVSRDLHVLFATMVEEQLVEAQQQAKAVEACASQAAQHMSGSHRRSGSITTHTSRTHHLIRCRTGPLTDSDTVTTRTPPLVPRACILDGLFATPHTHTRVRSVRNSTEGIISPGSPEGVRFHSGSNHLAIITPQPRTGWQASVSAGPAHLARKAPMSSSSSDDDPTPTTQQPARLKHSSSRHAVLAATMWDGTSEVHQTDVDESADEMVERLAHGGSCPPPWSMGEELGTAAELAWAKHFLPFIRDVSYLILCVPSAFNNKRMSTAGNASPQGHDTLSNMTWDRKTYCSALARMVALLERHRLWQLLGVLLRHAAEHGVVIKVRGMPLPHALTSPQNVRLILSHARHEDIAISYISDPEILVEAAEKLPDTASLLRLLDDPLSRGKTSWRPLSSPHAIPGPTSRRLSAIILPTEAAASAPVASSTDDPLAPLSMSSSVPTTCFFSSAPTLAMPFSRGSIDKGNGVNGLVQPSQRRKSTLSSERLVKLSDVTPMVLVPDTRLVTSGRHAAANEDLTPHQLSEAGRTSVLTTQDMMGIRVSGAVGNKKLADMLSTADEGGEGESPWSFVDYLDTVGSAWASSITQQHPRKPFAHSNTASAARGHAPVSSAAAVAAAEWIRSNTFGSTTTAESHGLTQRSSTRSFSAINGATSTATDASAVKCTCATCVTPVPSRPHDVVGMTCTSSATPAGGSGPSCTLTGAPGSNTSVTLWPPGPVQHLPSIFQISPGAHPATPTMATAHARNADAVVLKNSNVSSVLQQWFSAVIESASQWAGLDSTPGFHMRSTPGASTPSALAHLKGVDPRAWHMRVLLEQLMLIGLCVMLLLCWPWL